MPDFVDMVLRGGDEEDLETPDAYTECTCMDLDLSSLACLESPLSPIQPSWIDNEVPNTFDSIHGILDGCETRGSDGYTECVIPENEIDENSFSFANTTHDMEIGSEIFASSPEPDMPTFDDDQEMSSTYNDDTSDTFDSDSSDSVSSECDECTTLEGDCLELLRHTLAMSFSLPSRLS